MSRFNYDWSDQKLQRYIKEGRGQNEKKIYQPWLNVHSIPSRGRVSRVYGWKTQRVHHFLTDQELHYFYLLEWEDVLDDIREHYPLLDLYDMTEILDDDLLKKLIDRKTGMPHILTTTFLVTGKNEQGNTVYFARSIKEAKDIEKPSVIERYECIRRYWQAKQIPWGLITSAEVNSVKAKNVEWIHAARHLHEWGYEEKKLEKELQFLIEMLGESKDSIRDVLERFENRVQGDQGIGLLFFKHLLAIKKISIDMEKPIDMNQPAKVITINSIVIKERGDNWSYVIGS